MKIKFSYFSTKTYVVGTQTNRLNVRKHLNLTFYAKKFCLSKPVPTGICFCDTSTCTFVTMSHCDKRQQLKTTADEPTAP